MTTIAARLRRSLRPPRRLRFTTQGKWFTAMTFMVGFGAINTGNNLLYLLLGMMLGLIIVSGVMSEAMLRRLRGRRLAVESVYAGRRAVVEYRMVNSKRWIPSFSIEIRELEEPETRSRRLASLGVPLEGRSGRRAERDCRGVPRCLVQRVPPRSRVVRAGGVLLERRGLYRYRGLALVTRFPFGFFEKSREFEKSLELLVFPRLVEAPPLELPGERPDGVAPFADVGRGYEYHGLRDYHLGEDWRRIHWKVSARRGELIVRENERERTRVIALALYNVLTPEAGEAAERAMEHAIDIVAALARRLLSEGYGATLSTLEGTLSLGGGPAQLSNILRALALLDIQRSEGPVSMPRPPAGVASTLVVPMRDTPGPPKNSFDQVLLVSPSGTVRAEQ